MDSLKSKLTPRALLAITLLGLCIFFAVNNSFALSLSRDANFDSLYLGYNQVFYAGQEKQTPRIEMIYAKFDLETNDEDIKKLPPNSEFRRKLEDATFAVFKEVIGKDSEIKLVSSTTKNKIRDKDGNSPGNSRYAVYMKIQLVLQGNKSSSLPVGQSLAIIRPVFGRPGVFLTYPYHNYELPSAFIGEFGDESFLKTYQVRLKPMVEHEVKRILLGSAPRER